MYRKCREILCSFSEEEKLPKLSEEKSSPVVNADDDDDDVVNTKMKELTLVRKIVKPFATLKVSFSRVIVLAGKLASKQRRDNCNTTLYFQDLKLTSNPNPNLTFTTFPTKPKTTERSIPVL